MSQKFVAFIAAVLLAFSIACNRTSQSNGSLHLTLSISPERPRMTKSITFTVHAADPKGQPVNDANVAGDLTMKLMDMGTTKLTFTPKGNGDYEAQMKGVDMSGPWALAVDAKQGSTDVKQTFDVNVFD